MSHSKSSSSSPRSSNEPAQTAGANRQPPAYPNVAAAWLVKAAGIAVLGALVCAWLTLCLLYWQGSWQLLYHPAAAILRTPASAGLGYEPMRYDAAETGEPQLTGWWIPADAFAGRAPITVLYLHGGDGNMGDAIEDLAEIHSLGLAVFAFDYRGYGQSAPGRPSEARLLEDAEHTLSWLEDLRHIPPRQILLYGSGLGADMALELAAGHNDLAGLVLAQPLADPLAPVYSDPRSRLVPARWLVQDRYDMRASAAALRIPSLWILTQPGAISAIYEVVQGNKQSLWLRSSIDHDPNLAASLRRWLDDLQ